MATSSYMIAPGTTPEEIKRRRELAEAMLMQGMKPQQIEHWTQGVAQLMNAGIGGYMRHRAGQDEEAARRASLAAVVGGLYAPTPAEPQMSAPPPVVDDRPPLPTSGGMSPLPGATPPMSPVPPAMSPVPPGALDPKPQVAPTAAIDPDTDAMVRTLYGEARGEPEEGQRAVAAVILNRARERGQSPKDVVMAPNQFEPWGNPQTRIQLENLDPQSPEYLKLKALVDGLRSGQTQDPTGGADHFYSPTAQAGLGRNTPSWARGPSQDIGRHRFFNLEGNQPTAASAPVTQVADRTGGDNRQRLMQIINDPWTPDWAKKEAIERLDPNYQTNRDLLQRKARAEVENAENESAYKERELKIKEQEAEDKRTEAARKEAEAKKKADSLESSAALAADVVTTDIDRAIDMAEKKLATGGYSVLSAVPTTAAHNLAKMIDGIKANIGFDKLSAMRQSSPTGAALGPVSDFENKLLQATFGSLETSQNEEQLTYNLRRAKAIYQRIIHKGISPEEWQTLKDQDFRAPEATVDPDGWQQVAPGVRIREKK